MTHPIPDEALDSDIAIIARKGSGKSYLARGLAERLLDLKRRMVVIDPLGAWWGLRASADGTSAGYPVAVFGGEHGDMPLTATMGEPLAKLIAGDNLPCVIDTSLMRKEEQGRLAIDLFEGLFRLNRDPLTIVLEEADVFCLSADTEILARRGWLKWSDIREGEEVACFDPDSGTYSFGPVQRIIVQQHEGEMVRLKTKGVDCLVTPDHRVLMRRYHRGNHSPRGLRPWTFCAASDVPTSIGVPLGGAPIGPGVPGLTAEMARVLGWVITDGSIHDARQERHAYAIEQSHATVKAGIPIGDEMDRVLMALPGVTRYDRPARETASGGRVRKHAPSRRWYIAGATAAAIRTWLGEDIHRIPREIIDGANRAQLEALFDGLLEGDGTFQGRWSNFYPGQSEGLADDFQEIALRLGINATKSWSKTIGQWYVCMAPSRPHHWIRKPLRERYSGVVWDVTVPTGAFVARRNGRAFVTGNCPQNPAKDGYAAQVLHEVDRIARRGRARGLRLISLTQRPARLHKDVLSQAATLVAMRLSAPQDREAIKAWVEGNADRDQSREVIDSLASLAVGEGWVWAADLGILHRAKFPRIKTLDTSATPKAGETRIEPKTLAEVDVSTIRDALAVVEPTPDPRKSGSKYSDPMPDLAAAEERGYQRGLADWRVGFERELAASLADLVKQIDVATAELRRHLSGAPVTASPAAVSVPAAIAPRESRKVAQRAHAAPRAASGNDPLLAAALSIWPARGTWGMLASMCGRKARGGHFNTARKALIDSGLVRMDGDLVTPCNPPASPEGVIPADLLAMNLPQPAAKMFALIRNNPGVSPSGMASKLGMQPRGGHWNTGMSTLRRNGLIEERGDSLTIPQSLLGAST